MYKSLKIRIYPTKEQEELLWKHIHNSRFIWNKMLELQIELYKREEKHLSRFDMIKLLPYIKEKYIWLKEVSNGTLQTVCTDLSKTYDGFFNKISRFPKFKSRRNSKLTFPLRNDATYFKNNTTLVLPKIGKVLYKSSYNISLSKNTKLYNHRISFINNKWIISFGIEYDSQVFHKLKGKVGIDLGIKDLANVSYNGKHIVFHNINKSRRIRMLNSKLKHLQRNLSRKYRVNNSYEDTNNIIILKKQIKDVYYKLHNIRFNYIHHVTKFIVNLCPKRITIEDLNISGMMKNRHLSKAIQEMCLYEFRRQITYKAEMYGIKLVIADRWYPSSKICSECGNIKRNLKLSDRVYECEECGLKINRDFNAAINLEKYKI